MHMVYIWKADFELLEKYSVKWANGQQIFQDVTTVLPGSKGEMYAFGSLIYPDTDALRVVMAPTGMEPRNLDVSMSQARERNIVR